MSNLQLLYFSPPFQGGLRSKGQKRSRLGGRESTNATIGSICRWPWTKGWFWMSRTKKKLSKPLLISPWKGEKLIFF